MDQITAASDTITTSYTTSRMTGRIEVVGRVSGRRRWTVEQKLAILHDAFGPGGSRHTACKRHKVSGAQLYSWQRQALSGELIRAAPPASPAFATVEIADLSAPSVSARASGITIELPSGIRGSRWMPVLICRLWRASSAC